MNTKDRFDEFKVLSDQYSCANGQQDQPDFPVSLDEVMANDSDSLMPTTDDEWGSVEEFLGRVSHVQNGLHLLESYVEDVKIKHSQLLVSPHEDQQIKYELNQAMEAFKQLSESMRNEIKTHEGEIALLQKDREMRGLGSNSIDIRIRKTHHMGMSKRLHIVLRQYAFEQARFKDRCKERIQGYLDLTGKHVDDDQMDDMIHDGQFFEVAGGLLMEQKRNAQQMINDLAARRDDILRLERSVQELHSMFVDMAMMVDEQGEMVNRIEYHVMSAVNYSTKAHGHVKYAEKYRSKYQKKRFGLICCVVLLLFVLVAGAILYASVHLRILFRT